MGYGADFALRRDDELCAHDGESRIGVFDASESDGRTRHARRGRLHSRYRRSSGGLPVSRQVSTKFGNRKLPVVPAKYQYKSNQAYTGNELLWVFSGRSAGKVVYLKVISL